MYKALYRLFGGFVADVVAAIDQVRCYSISPCGLDAINQQNGIVRAVVFKNVIMFT